MDPATLTAIFGGITSILGGLALLIRQIRSTDPEDLKRLQARVERAEKRSEEVEDDLETAKREHKSEIEEIRKEHAEETEGLRSEIRKLRATVQTYEARLFVMGRTLRANNLDVPAEVPGEEA